MKKTESYFLSSSHGAVPYIRQEDKYLKKLKNIESFESCILSDTIIRNISELKQIFRIAASLSSLNRIIFYSYLPKKKRLKILAVHSKHPQDTYQSGQIFEKDRCPNIEFLIDNPRANISTICHPTSEDGDLAVRISTKGNIFFLSAKHDRPGEEIKDMSTLAILGGLIARSIHAMELIQKGFTDRLTGLYNRAALDKLIDEQQDIFDYELNTETIAGLCFIDLDNFKQVNDTYGHDVGDTVLKNLSEIIRKRTRGKHLMYRYGGDELVGIMFKNGKNDEKRIEREVGLMREEIIRKPLAFDKKGNPVYISVCIGLCHNNEALNAKQLKEKTKKDFRSHLVSLIRLADEAMYDSKIAGKNMIKIVHLN